MHCFIWTKQSGFGIINPFSKRGEAMKKHKLISSLFSRTGRFEQQTYDPERVYPVIRASICTGEKVAGFRDRKDGHFTEVMLIRSPKDEQEFKDIYKVDKLDVEY